MAREDKGNPMGSVNNAAQNSGADNNSSISARRARLRGSLARSAFPADEESPANLAEPMPVKTDDTKAEPKIAPVYAKSASAHPPTAGAKPASQSQIPQAPSAPAPQAQAVSVPAPTAAAIAEARPIVHSLPPEQSVSAGAPGRSHSQTASQPTPGMSTKADSLANSDQALELLNNIDAALNACATNLAALQRLAGEQTDVLKTLSNTLQNQTLFEIGLNLNSLTESLSAALEPMKAVGELVPAMDQLVNALEGRTSVEPEGERLTPDQLVTSLADQLSASLIDPWTFKCAYMAVYPSEHPADLLHRLVELLGTQRLSGDLFRAAYEAVQAAQPPGSTGGAGAAAASGGAAGGIANEHIRQQIAQLQKANDELRGRQEQREQELQDILHQKDAELQEAQGMLNSRYDEFNSRYDEVADALSKREDEYRTLLESKDMELVEKESELNLLRTQMDDLRNQTEEMVKDLQRQLADMKRQEPPKPQPSSFFDNPPAPARTTVTDPVPAAAGMAAFPAPQPVQQPAQHMQAPAQSAAAGQAAPPGQSPRGQSADPNQAAPQQPAATTPFSSGPGSYGSGVRAQVFEVIVRQALAGAPWREICSGPMQVNNISPDEVETEVKRRQALLNK